MTNSRDIIEEASDESFPASDPPAWTTTTGVGSPHAREKSKLEAPRVVRVGNQTVIYLGNCRGEELRQHLAAHGIRATLTPATEDALERLEIEGNVNHEVLQALLDEWEQ